MICFESLPPQLLHALNPIKASWRLHPSARLARRKHNVAESHQLHALLPVPIAGIHQRLPLLQKQRAARKTTPWATGGGWRQHARGRLLLPLLASGSWTPPCLANSLLPPSPVPPLLSHQRAMFRRQPDVRASQAATAHPLLLPTRLRPPCCRVAAPPRRFPPPARCAGRQTPPSAAACRRR